jgi:serine/threonine protein kinase
MAPEQAEQRRVDQRSDVFAFGVVLFELVAGKRPFGGDTPLAQMLAVVREPPAPLPPTDPKLPAALVELIVRCLDKDPERRPQGAGELVSVLEPLVMRADLMTLPLPPLDPSTVPAPVSPSRPGPATHKGSARRWWPLAVAGAGGALAITLITSALSGSSDTPPAAIVPAAPTVRTEIVDRLIPSPQPSGTVHAADGIRYAYIQDRALLIGSLGGEAELQVPGEYDG